MRDSKRDTDVHNSLLDSVGEGKGGMIWGNGKGQQMADEESLVGSYINHLMLDYKLLILKNQIQQLNKQLAQPVVIGDDDKCFGIMQQIANLNAVKRDMEKMLGDRVMN